MSGLKDDNELVNLSDKYLFLSYCVPGSFLGTGDAVVNKTETTCTLTEVSLRDVWGVSKDDKEAAYSDDLRRAFLYTVFRDGWTDGWVDGGRKGRIEG